MHASPQMLVRPVVSWDCGIPEHNHKSKEVAAACIAKYSTKRTPSQVKEHRQAQEAKALFACVQMLHGASVKKAAEIAGVHPTRIRQRLNQFIRQCHWAGITSPEHSWRDGLSELRDECDEWEAAFRELAKQKNIQLPKEPAPC